MNNILIVDDEPNTRLMYRSALETENLLVREVDSGRNALEALETFPFDAAIVDLRMPGMSGFELLEEMKARKIKTPVAIVTAHGDVPDVVQAMRLGAIDFLQKPLTVDELRRVVAEIVARHEPELGKGVPRDCDYYLRCAKREINRRDFEAARALLVRALELNPKSLPARNLCNVMLEMRSDEDAPELAGHEVRQGGLGWEGKVRCSERLRAPR